jgi:nucleoside-diphosphate-sugar epimerase
MTPTPDHTPVSRSALVVGGSGFIGSHLLDELALDHARLVSLDIVEPTRPIAGVEYERGDIRRPLDVEGDFDVVYNLAAVHRTPGHPDAEYFETNVAGASNVTSFCRERAIKTIVFASSISTYGPGEDQKTEDSQLSPVTSYGKSKTVAERIHREWLDEAPDHRLIVPRPAVTFGLGEGGNFDRLLRAMRQRRFVYPGRTDTIKSCGHVTDLVGSIAWALSLEDRTITYNFCYPERTTIAQIATAIADTFDIPAPRFCAPLKPMLALAKPFDLLEKAHLRTGINTARIMKLVEATNVYPTVLVERGYEFRTNLETGVELWAESLEAHARAR